VLTKILMPSSGQTTNESLIVRWLKKVGDEVKQGDALFEIETDKAVMEVESFADGVLLKINYTEGDTVTAGEIVAYIGNQGEYVPEQAAEIPKEPEVIPIPQDREPVQADQKKSSTVPDQGVPGLPKVLASPAARYLAKNKHVNLQDVAKHSLRPVIKQDDVRRYLETRQIVVEEVYDVIELTPMRRMIAKRMTESVTTVPQFTIAIDSDMTACIQLRKKLNDYLRADGITIAFHDIMMKCISKAIEKYPIINATFTDEHIKVYKHVNFGLAVSLEEGLVTPVVKQTDQKSLAAIARENARNITNARERKIQPSEMEGGTITLSNLGMFGIDHFTAIIQPPQSCVLAVGQIAEKPVSLNGQIVSRPIMTLTASFDHRVIDGAVGAAFLQQVRFLLENPELALV
jgi:pyruvate dehydrogenase E2 component (dihydrolipoamide acetyltransferase)